MLRGALLSLALHSALALFLLAGSWLLPGRAPAVLPVLAEVELVVQNTPAVGSRSAPAPAPPTPLTRPTSPTPPTHPPIHPPLGPPQAAAPPLPLPPPAAPPLPASRIAAAAHQAPASLPAAPPSPPATPGSSGTGLVSGSRVIPAALDRTVQNVPPAYPPRAVRKGEQGSVLLRVHVAANGSAASVDVFRSSGYRLLDQAAERAVGRWHFIPAREKGIAVPSTMLLRIRFRLTNPEGGQ